MMNGIAKDGEVMYIRVILLCMITKIEKRRMKVKGMNAKVKIKRVIIVEKIVTLIRRKIQLRISEVKGIAGHSLIMDG